MPIANSECSYGSVKKLISKITKKNNPFMGGLHPRSADIPSLDLDYAGALQLPGDARLALLGEFPARILLNLLLLARAVDLQPQHLPAQLRQQLSLLENLPLQSFARLSFLIDKKVRECCYYQ